MSVCLISEAFVPCSIHEPVPLQAWLLVVNLTFPNQKERDKFIELFAPLAQSVAAKERGVLGYELSVADNDPLKVVIFERCASSNSLCPSSQHVCFCSHLYDDDHHERFKVCSGPGKDPSD